MRDKNLDIFRGLIMIYIIGVVHVLYWSGVIEIAYKSFFLFEMPVIFFITGASYTLSSSQKITTYFKKRIERILIPYWFFSLVALSFMFVINYFLKSYSVKNTSISLSSLDMIIDWLNPFGQHQSNVSFIQWHLWFVPVYLLLMLFIPMLYLIFTKLNGILKFVPLVFFAFCIFFTDFYINLSGFFMNFKYVVFYIFWTYLGFFYLYFKNKPIRKSYLIILSVFFFSITSLLIFRGYYHADMQFNKFPPNFVFLLYTLGCFIILVLFKEIFINIASIKFFKGVIEAHANYGYTLYLFQPFSYIVLNVLTFEIFQIKLNNHKLLGFILYSVFVIYFGLVYIKILPNIEKMGFSDLKNIFKKQNSL